MAVTFDFKCKSCDHLFEERVPFDARGEDVPCPKCGKDSERQMPICRYRGPMFQERELIRRKHGSTMVDEKIEHDHMMSVRGNLFTRTGAQEAARLAKKARK